MERLAQLNMQCEENKLWYLEYYHQKLKLIAICFIYISYIFIKLTQNNSAL